MICKKCKTQNAPHMHKCFACGYTTFIEVYQQKIEDPSEKCEHRILVGRECPLCIREQHAAFRGKELVK